MTQQQTDVLFRTKVWLHQRDIVSNLTNFVNNLNKLKTESHNASKNIESLENLLEIPVDVADDTKLLTTSCKDLRDYATQETAKRNRLSSQSNRNQNSLFCQSTEKLEFASKAVRVAATMVVQNVEKLLELAPEKSFVSVVETADVLAKDDSVCPLAPRRLNTSTSRLLSTSLIRKVRRSSIHPTVLEEEGNS